MTRAPPSTAFVAGTFRAYDGHAQTSRLTFDGDGRSLLACEPELLYAVPERHPMYRDSGGSPD
jgi:hypothetical protein